MAVFHSKEVPQGHLTSPQGFKGAGVSVGIKKDGEKDVGLLFSEEPAAAAGVFTCNLFSAPPVLLTRDRIDSPVQALVVNSGNANACTGERGWRDAQETAAAGARWLELPESSVLVSSTGVIGEYLPMDLLYQGIERAWEGLSPQGGPQFANAILTTDTVTKETAWEAHTGAGSFLVGGTAKGSGMICPQMATMLSFLTTDLSIERELLQEALNRAVARSFNLISIDGDASTNDMVVIMANGASGTVIKERGEAFEAFCQVLETVCRDLAYRVVRDGEGTTKVISLEIKNAPSYDTARAIMRTVLNSLLVKTAFFGEDANWGRILMAVGNAGVSLDPQKVRLFLGPVLVADGGERVEFAEEEAAVVMGEKEVPVTIDLQQGEENLHAWGSDLSHRYVTINADYRT